MNTQNIPAGAPKPNQDAPSVFNKPIALVGLMGSGKSAVGRRLAKQLGLKFADSDQLVTEMAGVSITDIFDLAGEVKFRDMEFRAIQNQLQLPLFWPPVVDHLRTETASLLVKMPSLSG